MKYSFLMLAAFLTSTLLIQAVHADDLPEAYWSQAQANEVLDKTRTITLDPDTSALTSAESAAVQKLIEAGKIMNRLFEDSLHPQALASLQDLTRYRDQGSEQAAALLEIYYRSSGPITTSLDNQRVAFVPVGPEAPGKNVYPAGMTTEKLDAFMADNPELAAGILNLRTVVRESSEDNLARDLKMLDDYPVLDALHPGLRQRLADLKNHRDETPWYALPYSVRWAPDVVRAFELIDAAATDVRDEDPDLADYLFLRARDLLTDNYEAGDAAWVRGKFRNLNAQIGSYEVYADSLYGVKSFWSMNVLVRDIEKSNELTAAMGGLQAIQDSLSFGNGRKIQSDIPVGVYNILADFGQSRGANTATILPNDSAHTRKYGRTILLRYNIMTNPELFESRQEVFGAAVKPEFAADLTLEGPFYRTLWHEVGHYLGVDETASGRDLNEALSPWGSHYEEMKADLLSGYTSAFLHRNGDMDDDLYRSVKAASVLRVLQRNQPRTKEQPYQAMQLMQMNYFLEHGFLGFDEADARLVIHYDRYEEVISSMLKDVLEIQHKGNPQEAKAFIDKYTTWTPEMHERLAERLRGASSYRFVAVKYKALGRE
jgi:hypothetical protein